MINKHTLFTEKKSLYSSMLSDIRHAKNSVYLETYSFGNDKLGDIFRDALSEKAQAGLDVRLMVDDIGSHQGRSSTTTLISNGVKVYIFKKHRLSYDIFRSNTHRDHRKLLVIDKKIAYLGSSNINQDSLSWQDFDIRIHNPEAKKLSHAFLENTRLAGHHLFRTRRHLETMDIDDLSIIRDVPSLKNRVIQSQAIDIIAKAKINVCLCTPYFVPSRPLRKIMLNAAHRGLSCVLLIPQHSDANIVDILREHYLGPLAKSGWNIYYYTPRFLHAKFLLSEKELLMGSSNFDYRSFNLQFEINLRTNNTDIVNQGSVFQRKLVSESMPFDLNKWHKRSYWQKSAEKIIRPFAYWL